MRALLLVLVMGCATRPHPIDAPVVADDALLAAFGWSPPPVILIDEDNTLALAYAALWYDLKTRDLHQNAIPSELGPIARFFEHPPNYLDLEEGDMAKRQARRCEGKYCGGCTNGRLAMVSGRIVEPTHSLMKPPALIVASPRASAKTLLEVLYTTRGGIAVRDSERVRPLGIQFYVDTGYDCDRVEYIVKPTDTVQNLVDKLVLTTAPRLGLNPAEN